MKIEPNNIYLGDCLDLMKYIPDKSIDLIVTSPPYFNAREYSNWGSLESYLKDMKGILIESKRVLKNYSMIVLNVGDVICSPDGRNSTKRKYPLGAYFTMIFEELGMTFIDDIIWDKGEVQSKRNFVGEPYPFQKYPINCYEHILIFRKFEKDSIKPRCPVCNKNIAVSNGINNNTYTYECKNPSCRKSKHGRGVRYSTRQVQKIKKQKEENKIEEDLLNQFRRDIVKLNPVIKINSKGENVVNHPAPFPITIPEYAIKFFSGVGDIVLDQFMGSGTTAIACINTNRNYIGIEKEPKYYDIAKKRIESVTAVQTELKGV